VRHAPAPAERRERHRDPVVVVLHDGPALRKDVENRTSP